MRTRNSIRGFVHWSVGWSVGWSVTLELKSGKTRISAPAHPSATGGRVSGLVLPLLPLRDGVRRRQDCALGITVPTSLHRCEVVFPEIHYPSLIIMSRMRTWIITSFSDLRFHDGIPSFPQITHNQELIQAFSKVLSLSRSQFI